jgi:competence CoiA-like predicted nuclease
MLIAYDNKLKIKVSADKISKNTNHEHFRYVCLHCFQPVHLAVGTKMVAHFRHYSGNNHRDCENYMGSITGTELQKVVNSASRNKIIQTRIEFCVERKEFLVTIVFPEEKIDEYEKKSLSLNIVFSKHNGQNKSLPINKSNFSANEATPIYGGKNCNDFQVETAAFSKRIQIVESGTINFFRALTGETLETYARKEIENILYTNTKYYIVTERLSDIKSFGSNDASFYRGPIEEFSAFDKTLYFAEINFIKKEYSLEQKLGGFQWTLKAKEEAVILWPPMKLVDENFVTSQKEAYLETSFKIEAQSNTNIDEKSISYAQNFTKILVEKSLTKIVKDNIDLTISYSENSTSYQEIQCTSKETKKVELEPDGDYFLQKGKTIEKITRESVYLLEDSTLTRYKNTYPILRYTLSRTKKKTGQEILAEILKYYRRTMTFNEKLVNNLVLSVLAKSYVDECRQKGKINIRVLKFIREGII